MVDIFDEFYAEVARGAHAERQIFLHEFLHLTGSRAFSLIAVRQGFFGIAKDHCFGETVQENVIV